MEFRLIICPTSSGRFLLQRATALDWDYHLYGGSWKTTKAGSKSPVHWAKARPSGLCCLCREASFWLRFEVAFSGTLHAHVAAGAPAAGFLNYTAPAKAPAMSSASHS